jgi:hypothetical protein
MTTIIDTTDADIQRSNDLATAVFDGVLESIPAGDLPGVAYSLWVDLTHLLVNAGWTREELAKDLRHHATVAKKNA